MHLVSSFHSEHGRLFKYVGYTEPSVRALWIDWAKVIAAFAVVVTHVASIAWYNLNPNTLAWHVTSFYEISTRFCVPFFFISSGALLLNPKRNVDVTKIYKKYIPRALIALGLSSLLFAAAEAYFTEWSGWKDVLFRAIDGPYFIWYLWVLVALYVLTPTLRRIASDQDCLRYSIIVLAVLILGKSTVQSMWPNSILNMMFQNLILVTRGSEGIFYYLLGAFLCSHEFPASKRPFLYFLGWGCLIVALILNWLNTMRVGLDSYYVARDNILIAVYSVALVELLKHGNSVIRESAPSSWLLRTGLLIYLVHPFVRLAVEVYSPSAVSWLYLDPLVSVPLISMIIYFCSFVISLGLLGIYKLTCILMMGRRRQ